MKLTYFQKEFKKHKILGVHFRGIDRIIMPDHPFPLQSNKCLI